MHIAKISSKGQVIVPAIIRKELNLKQGDSISWETDLNGRAFVRRIEPIDLDYLAAISGTLTEWNSSEDDEAYRDL